jgi:hypothetical protein
MGCGSGCKDKDIVDKEFQDLSGWKGVSLEELLNRLQGYPGVEVRIYTVASTRMDKNSNDILHEGSGPNLEGGLATLCTCKHSMRQSRTPEEWRGRWVLGLTSRAKNNGFGGEHYLFYLMRVEYAFETHKELYEYLGSKNSKALKLKNAVNNRLGDIFEPKNNCTNSLDPTMYKFPRINHSHSDKWFKIDIAYNEKSCPLLLGDIENTFVWQKPSIKFALSRGAGNKKMHIGDDFFSLLASAE